MVHPSRPSFIAGNWKMNPATLEEAVTLAQQVRDGVRLDSPARVAICPPSIYLERLDRVLENSPIGLGAQNLYPEPKGAYTGEVSAAMLNAIGCTHVILGHSERRTLLGETDAFINRKLHAALANQALLPIVCVGETLDQRDAGQTLEVVKGQLEGSLAGLEADQAPQVTLAYEPVWAIGTGRTATPEQAQEVHAMIRDWLAQRFGAAIAARIVIQYGGSVKPDNARDLLAQPDIDGALVGGASLVAEDFLKIVEAAEAVLAG
ncbi:triosephosphate isomerase [Isosphaera pallida ATCC 43644]|uniref:Triosephosphate isomerase n=1 Tax=Isosphaera pallida (strain ATCC 43644 / DSM 9630 / IS1B) TaxID=575540 RepID=E8R230_ISOPI|nr:triose-phosphate isomerase [Isosphaera pallida]ADV62462.1 triosephosphate isomerase [Isosphaera pallida ATCC 43644]